MPKVYSIRSRKPRSNDPLHSAHCLAACPITSDTETKLLAGSAPMSICFDRKLTTWARLRGVSLRDEGLNRVQNKKRKYQVMFNAFILGSQRGPTRCAEILFFAQYFPWIKSIPVYSNSIVAACVSLQAMFHCCLHLTCMVCFTFVLRWVQPLPSYCHSCWSQPACGKNPEKLNENIWGDNIFLYEKQMTNRYE